MFARIVGGGICTMSPAAARQTRTAQSAADGRQKAPAKAGALPKADAGGQKRRTTTRSPAAEADEIMSAEPRERPSQ